MNLSVQMEKPSPILRKLTITVPAQEVQKEYERGLVEVQRTARLKGFRPGNVPLTMIKQVYGKDVRHQTLHNLIDESFQKAVEEQKLKAVGRPTIETPDHKTGEGAHDHDIEEGRDLTYVATVEVLPEIDVKNYTGISLKREQADVTEQDVEIVIKNIQESRAELIPAAGGLVLSDGTQSSRPVAKGDFVELAFSGGLVTESGVQPHEGMKGQRMLEVGSDSLVPGFEDNLVGMRKGETKTFRVTFPKDFYDKDIAGKEAEFTATINEIKEKKLPEINDEFAKSLNYETLDDMRKQAREHLTKERQQEADHKLRSDLLKVLIEKNSFDVPISLVQAQTRALAQDVAQNLKQQGANEETIKNLITQEMPNIEKRAESQVRASLLIEAIADKEGIRVAPEEIDAEISRMATDMRIDKDKLQEYYSKNPSRRADLEFRVREDRTVKFLFEKAKMK